MEQRVIVITGARGSVAKAIAKRFKDKNYIVYGLSRTSGQLDNYDFVYGVDYENLIALDLAKCDVLVNTIGINSTDLNACMKVNVDIPSKVINSLSSRLTSDSVVINISSVSGIKAGNNPAYSQSKNSLETLTKDLAKRLAPVRVMSIAPAFIEDSSWFKFDNEHKTKIINDTPLKRICQTKDVADAVESCVDLLKFSTGSTLLLDGGRLL